MAVATYDELLERRNALHVKAEEFHAKVESEDRDFTDEEKAEFDKMIEERDSLDKRAERLKNFTDADPVPQRRTKPDMLRQPGEPSPVAKDEEKRKTADAAQIEIPDNVRRCGSLRAFTRERFGERHRERAYRAGKWFLGFLGNQRCQQWSMEHGLGYDREHEKRVHGEAINWQGAILVPDEIDNDMIDLRESRGVFRRLARISPMASDTKNRRRRTGGLTAYAVGEGDQITESTKSWDWVNLVAKKWGVISTVTTELNEDSVISVGDDLASEIAYAFADKEDEAGFNGDGTSTYHGIVGIRNAFVNLTSTVANRAGQVVGTGNLYSELVLADFNDVVAKLPQYADGPEVRWVVHKSFFHEVMQKLAYAAGGNSTEHIVAGTPFAFLGYGVEFSQVMPKTEANDQICALLGNYRLGADFGDRRGTTIAFSDSGTVGSVNIFEQDEIAIRGTTRWDINVHDVGNQSGTAASRVPGPIVCLSTAAS
jgi:HK97 family phage major capsid protein